MRGRPLAVVALLALAGGAGGCAGDSGTGPSQASPSPSPSPRVASALPADAGSLLPEPPTATTPAPGAATALSAAAARNLAAGSLRVTMTLSVSGPTASYVINGKGELERPGRAHMASSLTALGRAFDAESVVYDGTLYTRSGQAPWKAGGNPGTANQPDAFVRYIAGARDVQDGGPVRRGSLDTERYNAVLTLPNAPAGSLPPSLSAWVDHVSGFVVAEEVVETASAGSRTLDVTVEFSDIGVPVTVTRPAA